jgi:hypothetical protein
VDDGIRREVLGDLHQAVDRHLVIGAPGMYPQLDA